MNKYPQTPSTLKTLKMNNTSTPLTIRTHCSVSKPRTMEFSLSTLLNVSRQALSGALQHMLRLPFFASHVNPQNMRNPPPSIAQPLSRERQRNRVDILAAEVPLREIPTGEFLTGEASTSETSISDIPISETERPDLLRYISHTGDQKRVRIGVDVRIYETRLFPIPSFYTDSQQVCTASIRGIVTGISDISNDWVTVTIRDTDTRGTFHLITPWRVTCISRGTILTHNLLCRLGLKQRASESRPEMEMVKVCRKREIPYNERDIPLIKPMADRSVRFLEQLGMSTKPTS